MRTRERRSSGYRPVRRPIRSKWPGCRGSESGSTRFSWPERASASWIEFTRWPSAPFTRKRRKKRFPGSAASGKTAVEKTLAPRAWKSKNDFHFPTVAAATAHLRLHFKCLDEQGQGYILRWLDTGLEDSVLTWCTLRNDFRTLLTI